MEPQSFHPNEVVFTSSDETIRDLRVLRVEFGDGSLGLMSCWRVSLVDIIRLLVGRRVYLTILGNLQPPVSLTTNKREVLDC